MEITYINHSCFKLKGKDVTVVIDPYDPKKTGYKLPKLEADIVLTTHDHPDHNFVEGVTGYKHHFSLPGEYEVGGVFVEGYGTFHDTKMGKDRGVNTTFVVEMDEVTFLHLGDLGHEIPEEILEQMPEIDVLFVPVGGAYTIDAETATEIVSSIEPGIVVPMHYKTDDSKGDFGKLDPLKKFLEEMGSEDQKTVDKLKLSGRSDIPEETQVVVIQPTT